MDKNKDPRQHILDEAWDVEQALREKHGQRSDPQAAPVRQSASPAPRSKKKRSSAPASKSGAHRLMNRRDLMILVGLLAAIVVIIILVVAIASRSGGDDTPETEVYGPTYPLVYVAEELVEQADVLAAGYDYDAAIALLLSFGEGWQEQEALTEAKARYEAEKAALVRWPDTTTIPHIYFESLIVDTARAFDGDSDADSYNQDMVTVTEFKAILQALYDNGYVLVSLHDIAVPGTNAEGAAAYVQGDIYLPEGKKPLILSQDDVNYYDYMVDGNDDGTPDAQGDGFACQLAVDENGDITCRYIDAEGQELYGDYDLVPILENFIREHPDFSYRGARAVLAVTGYEGVFGYDTTAADKEALGAEAYAEQVRQAAEVAEWLRDNGWEVASHSYNHAAYGYNEVNTVLADLERWETEVGSIVGETDVLFYPFGIDIAGEEDYEGSKYEAMYAKGFRYFCGTDSSEYWVQIRDDYVRQDRRAISGYYMYWWPELLDDLFDAKSILDPARPEVPKNN